MIKPYLNIKTDRQSSELLKIGVVTTQIHDNITLTSATLQNVAKIIVLHKKGAQ